MNHTTSVAVRVLIVIITCALPSLAATRTPDAFAAEVNQVIQTVVARTAGQFSWDQAAGKCVDKKSGAIGGHNKVDAKKLNSSNIDCADFRGMNISGASWRLIINSKGAICDSLTVFPAAAHDEDREMALVCNKQGEIQEEDRF